MSIEEILQEIGVPFLRSGHHHCRPGWIQLDCPFCGAGSQRYHLGWNLTLQYTNCWKCGGHHPDHVLQALGLSPQRSRELARALTPAEPQKRVVTRTVLKQPHGLGSLLKPHKRYLRERGFDPREIERVWKVQGIGIATRLGWRIFIPIHWQERFVSWTTRSIGEGAVQRYISAAAAEEAVNHKTLVYGQDYCRHSIVIVEGPLDAWRVGPGAGALFGTAFTAAQVRKLVDHPYRYIVFDSEKKAQSRAEQLANQLSVFPGVTEVIELDAADPGSATPREINRLRKAAKL